MALRVVFFGTPDFAVPSLALLLRSEHAVVAVVTQPDRPRGRGHRVTSPPVKVEAQRAGVPVFQPERLSETEFLNALRALEPDLGVVAAYGRLLPQALLDLPRLGMINVHASLLPRWRGAAPVQRAIMAGDETTGVTIMKVVKALDAGPMLARISTPVDLNDTGATVESRLATLGARLLVDVTDRMAAGPVHLEPQRDEDATYAPKITRTDSPVDWSRTARQIHDHVRALQPWPQASTWIEGRRVMLRLTAVDDTDATESPGTIVVADGDDLRIAAGRGQLRVLEVQPEGRAAMSVRAYLNGHPVRAGARCSQSPA